MHALFWHVPAGARSRRLNGRAIYCPRCVSPVEHGQEHRAAQEEEEDSSAASLFTVSLTEELS